MNASVRADTPKGHELVDGLVAGVVASVQHDMRGQPASMVLEILTATLARRLPGIPVDDETMRLAAARISVGLAGLPARHPSVEPSKAHAAAAAVPALG